MGSPAAHRPSGILNVKDRCFGVAGFMHTKPMTGASIEYFVVGGRNRNVTLTKYDDAE